jgi:hypothetical protein
LMTPDNQVNRQKLANRLAQCSALTSSQRTANR